MSGPAVPGRFSFRFSRQPSCVTVDYTVQARAVEGRPQVREEKNAGAACCCCTRKRREKGLVLVSRDVVALERKVGSG